MDLKVKPNKHQTFTSVTKIVLNTKSESDKLAKITNRLKKEGHIIWHTVTGEADYLVAKSGLEHDLVIFSAFNKAKIKTITSNEDLGARIESQELQGNETIINAIKKCFK